MLSEAKHLYQPLCGGWRRGVAGQPLERLLEEGRVLGASGLAPPEGPGEILRFAQNDPEWRQNGPE